MRSMLAIALVAALAGGVAAQTTGVPFVNDYTIAGAGSGTTSCTVLTVPGGVNLPYRVTTSPGTIVTFFFSLCPCTPGFTLLPPTACPLPFTAGGGITNHSFDIMLGVAACPTKSVSVVSNFFGVATFVANFPPGFTLSTQAVVSAPACDPNMRVMSQAYQVNYI